MKKPWTWIITPIICSIVFAIVVHILYSIPAPTECLVHKWEAGDILTYVSTVALGLLAVWQNQRFKEENDKAQERLERISIEANELNTISRFIDVELQNVSLLDDVFTELFQACGPESISMLMMEPYDKKNVSSALVRSQQSLARFVQVFQSVYQINGQDAMPLRDTCVIIAKTSNEILRNYLNNQQRDEGALEALADLYNPIVAEKEAYISTRRYVLNTIVVEKISLDEIRNTYVNPMEDEDGENENGVN